MTKKSDATRAKILRAALARFRRHGFEESTMREIADAAGVAASAAYYYFPSKESFILAYYAETQAASTLAARAAFREHDDARARLGAILHEKLDVLAKDRKLLSGLFRSIGDPQSPTSIFGEATRAVREESIQLFDEALATSTDAAALDPASRRVLVLALWGLHMGFMLFFIHDESPKQKKTRRLVDGTLDLVASLLPAAPMLAPMFASQIATILGDAGILGHAMKPQRPTPSRD